MTRRRRCIRMRTDELVRFQAPPREPIDWAGDVDGRVEGENPPPARRRRRRRAHQLSLEL